MQDLLEHVVGLGAPAQRLGERGGADRHDHELLHVDVVVGVLATVEHVHHRHGQHVGVDAADVAVERHGQLVGGGLGDGERHAEDGVGAEAALVVGAVELDEHAVDVALVEGVEAHEGVVDLVVDVGDGVEHALAAVAGLAVAQLDRLERTGGGARRDDGPAGGAGLEDDLDLDGGVATGVEDLTAGDVLDDAHGTEGSSSLGGWPRMLSRRARGWRMPRADPPDACPSRPPTPVDPDPLAAVPPSCPSPPPVLARRRAPHGDARRQARTGEAGGGEGVRCRRRARRRGRCRGSGRPRRAGRSRGRRRRGGPGRPRRAGARRWCRRR